MKDWFSLRVLPTQVLKVNKRWQLGNSPVALRVNYECPLDNLSNPFQSPSRLMVRYRRDSSLNRRVAAHTEEANAVLARATQPLCVWHLFVLSCASKLPVDKLGFFEG